MDRQLLRSQRNPSAMEIELPRQNSSSDLPQPNPRFTELQLRRDKRRTSENKFADLRSTQPATLEQKICEFCQQLILLTVYDQHLLECTKRTESQQMNNTDALVIEDLEESRNQEEPHQPANIEVEENQLQLARPLPNLSEEQPQQQAPENFFNLFGRFRNPTRTFPRPENQEPQAPAPTSLLSTLFSSLFNPARNQEQANPLPLQSEQPSPHSVQQEQQNQPGNEGILPRGAIFVRTIQPGPNGTVIVRMRVIPLGNLFRNQEENREGNEPQEGGMFGSLLHMLMGLHGGHAGFPGFMNLFEEERGLEKEALESLPVVPYTNEAFKNVDEELKSCPICLDQFEEGNEIRFLWCLHRFHKNCVDQWLDKHTNCPICKKDYAEAIKGCEESS